MFSLPALLGFNVPQKKKKNRQTLEKLVPVIGDRKRQKKKTKNTQVMSYSSCPDSVPAWEYLRVFGK